MRVEKVDGLVTLFYDGSRELSNFDLDSIEWGIASMFNEEEDIEALNLSDEYATTSRESSLLIPSSGLKDLLSIFAKDLSLSNAHLQFIGQSALSNCNLTSIFTPTSCRDIGTEAFACNENLTILNVSQDAILGYYIIRSTELHKRSQFNHEDPFNNDESPQINTWLKNINQNDEFDLHRICSSFEPTLDMILNTMKEKGGPNAFKVRNSIGTTPSQYLKENPYADVKEKDIIKKYVLQMTGEL